MADYIQEELAGHEYVQWPIAGHHILRAQIVNGEASWIDPTNDANVGTYRRSVRDPSYLTRHHARLAHLTLVDNCCYLRNFPRGSL
jgi:hypothetical protein